MGLRSYWDMTREVFSNRNILVISLTTSLWSLVQMAYNPFWPKYMKDYLGASATIIGMFSMIATAENLLFQLPGGMLADRYGRRKIIIIGTFMRTFAPLIYFFAPSWEWIILAAMFNGASSLYMPAFNAIIADSIPEKRRGTGYGAYNMITSLPGMVSPIIGGWAVEKYGYYDGVRIFILLNVATSLIMTALRWKYLNETVEEGSSTRKPKIMLSRAILNEFPKPVKVMILVSIIGSFSGRLVWDFMSLYALEVVKLTPAQFGLITTVCGGISALLALPGGMLSDTYGRKNNIMIGRLFSPISIGLITFTSSFQTYFGVRAFNSAAIAVGGGSMDHGGPSWNALLADLVPPDKRATVHGVIGTLTAVVAAPSSVIGGWLWDNVSKQLPFQIAMVVGLLSAGIFWVGVEEPGKEKPPEKPTG